MGEQERKFSLGRARTSCQETNAGSGTGEVLSLNKRESIRAKISIQPERRFSSSLDLGSICFPSDIPSTFQKEQLSWPAGAKELFSKRERLPSRIWQTQVTPRLAGSSGRAVTYL